MKYRTHIRDAVKSGDNSLGPQLGRAAVRLGFPVVHVAAATGATRATVYSWYYGNRVSNAYRNAVTRLTNILCSAPNAAAAWSQACKTFQIPNPSPMRSSSESVDRP